MVSQYFQLVLSHLIVHSMREVFFPFPSDEPSHLCHRLIQITIRKEQTIPNGNFNSILIDCRTFDSPLSSNKVMRSVDNNNLSIGELLYKNTRRLSGCVCEHTDHYRSHLKLLHKITLLLPRIFTLRRLRPTPTTHHWCQQQQQTPKHAHTRAHGTRLQCAQDDGIAKRMANM